MSIGAEQKLSPATGVRLNSDGSLTLIQRVGERFTPLTAAEVSELSRLLHERKDQ